MAFAEYDVVIHCDAMSVYNFLLDPGHLPLWRDGVRSVELLSAPQAPRVPCTSRPSPDRAAGPWPRTSKSSKPGRARRFSTRSSSARLRPRGGYYLSTEGRSTRVRFALNCEPRGFVIRMTSPFRLANEGRGWPA